ncbi:hypothetical protein BNJ_00071 [Kaumoebavirus]|uniref:hypothetical protein n=1 Tax=Kaumoebavirus TaxID=1859492 RepID=UPI0009C2369D|nr:hypothetical protein BNJ_00071 [Kaumoebavirus]ARA71913.1 hypothetical protein BNJ_00071 [Kaumoebavirus]
MIFPEFKVKVVGFFYFYVWILIESIPNYIKPRINVSLIPLSDKNESSSGDM